MGCNPRCFDSKCKLGDGCTGCDGCTGISPYTWLEWANLSGQGKVKTCTSSANPTDPPKKDPADPTKTDPTDPPKKDPADPPKKDPADPTTTNPEIAAVPSGVTRSGLLVSVVGWCTCLTFM